MTLSTRRIVAGTAAAAVVLLLIWYGALFRPESRHLSAARSSYAAAQQQIASLNAETASLRALLAKVPADTAHLAALNAEVPKSPDLKDVLNQLHDLATSTGVQLTAVGPSQPGTAGSATAAKTSTGASPISTSLTASGPYAAVYAFMAGLTRMQRTLVIDSVSLSPGTAGAVSASLSTRIFYSA